MIRIISNIEIKHSKFFTEISANIWFYGFKFKSSWWIKFEIAICYEELMYIYIKI